MFRAFICPSSGARDYTCVIAAYGLWCLGCWWSVPHPGRIACCSTPNSRPPATKALHTTCGNNTSVVSSSWWWAYECPKHVEQILIAIKHSVASSSFSSLGLKCCGIYILAQAIFGPKRFPYKYPNILNPSHSFTVTRLWRWNRQSVPKRRHIKFRRRKTTLKKA